MSRDGLLLIEVPLFDKNELLPFGYFTLEHLNYFSENVLKNYLIKSLFKINKINKSYNGPYPVITTYAKKSHNKKILKSEIKSDFKKNEKLIKLYLKVQSLKIESIKKNILKKIPKNSKLYFYGAGLHTSILFNFIYDFLIDNFIIIGFFDSSNLKKNKLFYMNKVHLFDKNKIEKDAFIVISSLNSENEILKYLNSFEIKNNIIKLHG